MRLRHVVIGLLTGSILFSLVASRLAQSVQASGDRTAERSSTLLEWRPDEKERQIGNAVYTLPVHCGRGAPFLRLVILREGSIPDLDHLVLMAGENAPVAIDIAKASTVKEGHVLSFFATNSDVVVLVDGADDLRLEKQRIRVLPAPDASEEPREFEQTRNRADHHRYLLHFDFSGELKRVDRLEDSFAASVVAEFESGTLLLGGLTDERQPRWAIADDRGVVRSLIVLPGEGKMREGAAKSFKIEGFGGPTPVSSMFANTQIIAHRGQLVVIPQSKQPSVYVIDDGGAVRQLNLILPAGVEQAGSIPSESSFYVRGKSTAKALPASRATGAIYRISFETGELLEEYDPGKVPVSGVVCTAGDQFVALHYENGKALLLKGSPK